MDTIIISYIFINPMISDHSSLFIHKTGYIFTYLFLHQFNFFFLFQMTSVDSFDSFESFESTALEALPFEELLDPNTPTEPLSGSHHPLTSIHKSRINVPPSPSSSCDDLLDVVCMKQFI